MNQTWENGKKPSFEPDFGPYGPNSGCQFFFFFFKTLAPLTHGQLSSCTISEKMIQSWENLVTDGETDRQMDRQTGGQEWFQRTLSD